MCQVFGEWRGLSAGNLDVAETRQSRVLLVMFDLVNVCCDVCLTYL